MNITFLLNNNKINKSTHFILNLNLVNYLE